MVKSKYLLENILTKEDPKKIKESILGIAQIFFDEVLDPTGTLETNQKEIWGSVWRAVELAVPGYCKNDLSRELIRNEMSKHRWILGRCKNSYKRDAAYEFWMETLLLPFADEVYSGLNEKVDLIIPVASGGFEPAALCEYYLGVTNILPIRYSYYRKNDCAVLVPPWESQETLEKNIGGKNILLAEDAIVRGKTLEGVSRWLEQYKPEKIYLAAVNFCGSPAILQYSEHDGLYHDIKIPKK